MRHRDAMGSMIHLASLNLAETLGRFKPWHGSEPITEANLVLQLASVFTNRTPKGMAFVEVPFKGKGKRTDKRLDLLLSNAECGYLVESKILHSEEQAQSIAKDISRLDGDLVSELSGRYIQDAPAHWHGVVLAETWNREVVKWWKSDSTTKRRWKRSGYPENWHFDSVEVHRVHDGTEGTLFWVWGIGPALDRFTKPS